MEFGKGAIPTEKKLELFFVDNIEEMKNPKSVKLEDINDFLTKGAYHIKIVGDKGREEQYGLSKGQVRDVVKSTERGQIYIEKV